MASLKRRKARDTAKQSGNILTATEVWQLLDATSADCVAAITEATVLGLPELGDSQQSNSTTRAVDISAVHDQDQGNVFAITVSYTNERTVLDISSSQSPFTLPTAVTYDQVDNLTVVLKDTVTGLAFKNSADDLYTTAFQENKPLTRITLVRNERDFDAKKAATLRNKVCPNAVKIDGFTYEANTAKLERYTASKQFDAGGSSGYFRVTYQILINEDTFIRKVFDIGNRDAKKNSPGADFVLQGSNLGLLDGAGLFQLPSADPFILPFNTLLTEDWSFLGLE
jgi:hypothetical protein